LRSSSRAAATNVRIEAERQFRKIIGYRDLATLVLAIERDYDRRRHPVNAAHTPTKEAAIVLTA
jgi:hypothetical protein